MVKFAHMADVHLGCWRDPKMKQLTTLAFEQSIALCLKREVDFLIIAGDLFNNALPSIDVVKDCVRQLKRLKHANIPVYVIGGSHDYAVSGKTMLDVLEEAELMVNVMKGTVENDILTLKFTEDLKTGVKLIGILGKRGMLDRQYYEKLNKASLEQEEGTKIFLFHTALTEFKPKGYGSMDSSPLELLPKNFTYYAGGHVHYVFKKEEPEYGQIVYPGPLFPANFAELEELEHGGFWIWEDGTLTREDIVLNECSTYDIDLTGKTSEEAMAELLKETSEECKDHLVLLRLHGQLKGKTTDLDYRGLFQQLYANGAYFVMKNTSKLISEELDIEHTSSQSTNEVEEELLKANTGKVEVDFDELEMAKKLLVALDNEKHEGEKVYEYEERVKKEVAKTLRLSL